jgi:hypothetical protein
VGGQCVFYLFCFLGRRFFLFSISVLDYKSHLVLIRKEKSTGVTFNSSHIVGILLKMPLGGLLAPRSKTDYAKQLKEFFTVIENEQDKEKKNYEEVKF